MDQQKAKEWLLKGVSKATKEVQLLYAQEKKPIKECRATRHLCATFENILRNGLRSRLLGFKKNSFWPLILKISRRQAIKYISSLQHAHTEMGRCRAWIRLAVNECALENYIGVLCQDESLLSQYYEPTAFLKDQEMREALKHLLTGLSELTFDIDVDTVSLEFEAPPEALQQSYLRMRPLKEQQTHGRKRRKGPKRTEASTSTSREAQEEVVTSSDDSCDSSDEDYASFDDDDDTTTTATTGTQGSTDHSSKDDDTMVTNQKEQAVKSQYSDQLTDHIDSLSHHIDEPLPAPTNNNNISEELVDHFENPDLETEQSLLTAADYTNSTAISNTVVSTATSVIDNKITSPVPDLETEQSLLPVVVGNATPPATVTYSDDFIDQTSNLISNIDDEVKEMLATEVILEHKSDEFPANETYINESKDLLSEEFVHIEDATEIKKNTTESELSEFIEDHYSKEATHKELRKKIQEVKNVLLKLQPDTNEYRAHKEELIRLNALLEPTQEDSKCEIVFGHKLIKMRGPSLKSWSCDACGHKSFNLLKPHYLCQECGYTCHMKCISVIGSTCISTKLGNEIEFILKICPEMTLTAQHFRCHSCNKTISYGTTQMEPQLCDYTGAYHCPECHHNQTHMIPARIIHNWDFTEYKVCCGCFELLQALSVRPLLHLHKISPTLYTYVQDLEEMEQLRNDFIAMKNYFVDCSVAKEQKLLQKLDQWPHFKENSKLYSLHDLYNIATGDLMTQLKETHQLYSNHITLACHNCRSHGITCSLCRAQELLYPFSGHVSTCPQCSLLFHKSCFEASQCPQCAEKP